MTPSLSAKHAAHKSLLAGTPERTVCEWDSLPNERFNFWTIGNVSEVIPGIMSPMTATIYRSMDYQGVRRVAAAIDSLDLFAPAEPPVGNFISCFGGRAVLNLAWANALIQLWQTGEGSNLMDQFVTSTGGQNISVGGAADQERARRTFALVKRVWGQLPRAVEADRRRIEAARARERVHDHRGLSEAALWRHVRQLIGQGIDPYVRHLFVSGAAGEYTQWLGKLLDRALPDHDPNLVIGLTSALRGVESAQPSIAVWDMARSIDRSKRLAAEFAEFPSAEIVRRLAAPVGAEWMSVGAEFGAFIERFGFRGQREADPSAADWEEDPTFAVSALKAYLQAGNDKNPHNLEEAAARRREAIEADVLQAMPRGERAEYRRLLGGAQRFTRLRESSKANWVRATRPIRPALLALAERFQARGLIAARDDFWYLEAEEAGETAHGRLQPEGAKACIARRQAQRAGLEAYTLPEVFQTPVALVPMQLPDAPQGGILTGMPVSVGTATGRARVVLSAESAEDVELLPGEILIAPFTDAPWTPLFVIAAAVVVETGGILSHAATVAREFGIPAVVAVKGATRLIRTGQLVAVDGVSGRVSILE